MLTLSFRYRPSSDLPRRTFHVDLTVNGCRHVACQVTAPDALQAEQVVRRNLPTLEPGLGSFQFDLVREVTTDYDRRVGVKVPLTFERVLTVSYR